MQEARLFRSIHSSRPKLRVHFFAISNLIHPVRYPARTGAHEESPKESPHCLAQCVRVSVVLGCGWIALSAQPGQTAATRASAYRDRVLAARRHVSA
jgi:hypothetical protein